MQRINKPCAEQLHSLLSVVARIVKWLKPALGFGEQGEDNPGWR